MKMLTIEQMRHIEQECAKFGLPTDALMENAGKAIAEEVQLTLGNINGKRITFLIGPGPTPRNSRNISCPVIHRPDVLAPANGLS